MQPWQLVLIGVAGWMNRRRQQLIDYLLEENRVLREQLGKQRLSFSAAQKKRLALKAKAVGLKRLKEIASAATPVHGELLFRLQLEAQTTHGNGIASGNSQGWLLGVSSIVTAD